MVASVDASLATSLDALGGWALVVALARVAPLVTVALALGGLPLPRIAQGALALVIALVVAGGLAPAAAVIAAASWGERALVLGREVLVGATLGAVAGVPLAAAAAAGAWAAAAGDSDDAGVGAWSWAFPLTAATVFFAVGGHLAVVAALGQSYRALPAGTVGAEANGDMLVVIAGSGARMIAAGVALAAPLMVAAMLASLLIGVIERAAGLPVALVPEVAVRRVLVVLVAAAAVFAIAMAIAGETRALPAAVSAAVERIAGR